MKIPKVNLTATKIAKALGASKVIPNFALPSFLATPGLIRWKTNEPEDNFKIIKALKKKTITKIEAKKIFNNKGFLNEEGKYVKFFEDDFMHVGEGFDWTSANKKKPNKLSET